MKQICPLQELHCTGERINKRSHFGYRWHLFTISSGTRLYFWFFSILGYQSIEYKIDKVPQTIKLLPKVDELDEVTVFILLNRKRKCDWSNINLKTWKIKIPTSNLTQALGGNVAGIISYQLSGWTWKWQCGILLFAVWQLFGYSKSPLILIDNIGIIYYWSFPDCPQMTLLLFYNERCNSNCHLWCTRS